MPKMHRVYKAALCLALLVLFAPLNMAHTRSQSFSQWLIDGSQVRGHFSTTAVEVTRLGVLQDADTLEALLAEHLQQALQVSVGEISCPLTQAPEASSSGGRVRVDLLFECPQATEEFLLVNQAFFAVAPSHLHFARYVQDSGEQVEYLFTDTERTHTFSSQTQPRTSGLSVFFDYLELGVTHILIGADHLAFVLCLLLLCGFSRWLMYAITGFTLGHSLALGLAAFDVVRPNIAAVEALIGFSIVVVALEWVVRRLSADDGARVIIGAGLLLFCATLWSLGSNNLALGSVELFGLALFTLCYLFLAPRAGSALILVVTSLFGLIHGFGFSSVLLEIGLSTDRLVTSLVAFNLGVEVGQILFCGGLLGLSHLLRQRLNQRHRLLFSGGLVSALSALGVFWFVSRGLLV